MMVNETTTEISREQIESAAKVIFTAGYKPEDEEVLGILISHTLEWDGYAILRTLFYALEDAKFHKEGEQLHEMFPEAFEEVQSEEVEEEEEEEEEDDE